MTGMLASVANLAEARLVQSAGVDIIDLKNPVAGALGALPRPLIARVVEDLAGTTPISATIGDLPMHIDVVRDAVLATASTGVDYVKIGFFPGGNWNAVVSSLNMLSQADIRLIAVLFGDQSPDIGILPCLADAGFAGAMLDTMDKHQGSLTGICPPSYLHDFVATTSELGLLCGLAGSLRPEDVPILLRLKPDYLGFRGALCRQNARSADLDQCRVGKIRELVTSGELVEPA